MRSSFAVRLSGMAVVAVSLMSSVAFASKWQETLYPGSSCQSSIATIGVFDTQQGIENNSSADGIDVYCPMPFYLQSDWATSAANPGWIVIYYNDQNSGSGAAAAVSCWAEESANGGAIVTTPTKYACSTAGGCTTVTDGTFASNLILDLTSGTFTSSLNYVDGDYHATNVVCKLPTEDSGHMSSIQQYATAQAFPTL